jgi:WD repeat-containing protein 35
MFVFLNKKISMPNDVKIRSISWNQVDGWICCGGEKGILKILQLDESKTSKGGLSINYNLEGHQGPITIIVWNPIYKLLFI